MDQAPSRGTGHRPSSAPPSAAIHSQVLDTRHLPAAHSRDVWREITEGTYALERPAAPGCGNRVAARIWLLDDILAADFAAEGNTIHRSERLIAQNPSPLLKLRIYSHGLTRVWDDTRSATLGAGAIHFVSNDSAHREESTDHAHVGLFVPHHLLGYDPSRHAPWFSIALGSPAGRLIASGLDAAFGALADAAAADAPVLASGLVGLLRGTLEGGWDSSDNADVRSARIAAMKRFIDLHLHDPALGADLLLAQFAVSRTTLYRDFADCGGLQSYILARRLHRAYRLLAEAPGSRGAVQAVSEALGFSSVSHFSRAFRQAHGIAPSAIVGHWHAPPDSPPAAPDAPPAVAETQTRLLRWAYRRYGGAPQPAAR